MSRRSFSPSVAVRILLILVVLSLLAISPAFAAPDAPTAISVKLEQCANGPNNENPTCNPTSGNTGWVNGNVNGQKARYAVGQFLPYRYVIDGLVDDAQYCFGMSWDVTDQGQPALDYIATFNETLPNANPLYGTEYDLGVGNPLAPNGSVTIPPDPALTGTINALPFTGTQQSGVISAWGVGGIVIFPQNPAPGYTYSNLATSDLATSNSAQSLQFCFNTLAGVTQNGQVVISWSGHIADPVEWGGQPLPSGSPYHMRTGTETLDEVGYWLPRTSNGDISQTVNPGTPNEVTTHTNIGSQEVQLAATAVTPPLAVTLASFEAQCSGATPEITWETASEINNQGFNLYRGVDAAAWNTQLNATLIPSQAPGSAQGFVYTWTDTTAAPNTEYFYWLEDVDLSGATGLHGPVSTLCSSPTAVTLSELDASSPAQATLSGWLIALLLAAVLAGFAAMRRLRTN